MNDPNGLIQWNGTYHLFYQYNPNGAFWGTMHWGHAKSDDLISWTHMPIALAPDPDGPDADGCFSGCAVNVDGRPTLMYTGVRGEAQLPCVAISPNDDLSTWEKLSDNPVIKSPPTELDTTIFRDHSIWMEGENWYQVIGSGVQGLGGTALLYRSIDFRSWSFVGSLVPLEQVAKGIAKDAIGWECPDFFQANDQHVLIAAMWDERPICVAYFAGNFLDEQFVPRSSGVVDGGESFYAPQSFTDESGRRVMFGWLREIRSVEEQIKAGWSGVMSLPRIVSVVSDGSLSTAPAPEVQQLRGRHIRFSAEDVSSDPLDLGDIPGDSMDLLVTMSTGMTGSVEIQVLRSSDGAESTKIIYDAGAGRLTVDTYKSSRSEGAEAGVFGIDVVPTDTSASFLRVFVDHSIVEVYFNDQKCVTARAYPLNGREARCRVVASHGVKALPSVDVWEMMPITFAIQ
jgi:beta-fructofuranosidase